MQEIKIVPSSPKSQTKRKPASMANKYPFRDLQVGESFIVDLATCKEGSIRSVASILSKGGELKFTVCRHVEDNVLEVARLK